MEHPLSAPDSVGVRYHRGRRYVEMVCEPSLLPTAIRNFWFCVDNDKLLLYDSGVDLILCDRQDTLGLEKFYVLDNSDNFRGVFSQGS